MLATIRRWIDRVFEQEETVVLLLLLLVGLGLLLSLGNVLAPFIAALVMAFMMQGLILKLRARGVSEWMAITIAFVVFMGIFFGVLLVLLPLVWQQATALVSEFPAMISKLQSVLMMVPERYEYITEEQLRELTATAAAELGKFGQTIVSFSIAQLPNLFSLGVYLIIIPILVFFFLKDKDQMLAWMAGFLPAKRPLLNAVWDEMNDQLANYIRGKAIEILIVGSASYLAFVSMGLNYSALLGLLVGLSVVIPFIGAAAVTIPVLLVGYLQWGLGGEFYTLFFVYGLIQMIDGNVLVPLLFSEAVNMHPVAIILSVLVFGALWGLWGVFFAIPLATLIKAVLNAWPNPSTVSAEHSA